MKKRLSLYVSFVVGVVLLVGLLPRQTKVALDYEQGKPWRYAPLIASFDFPILKSEAEIQAEKDSALHSFQPFFNQLPDVETRQIEALRSDFAAGRFSNVSEAYLNHAAAMLQEVYAAGVLSPDAMAEQLAQGAGAVRVVTGQEAMSLPIAELYSTRSAYDFIMDADSAHFAHEVLARLNLNNYLVPNLVLDERKTRTAREDLLNAVASNSGMVVSGQRIIDRGEIVSTAQKQILDSYVHESKRLNQDTGGFWRRIAGQGLFVLLMLSVFLVYLQMFRRDYLGQPHAVLLFLFLVVVFPAVTYIMTRQNSPDTFIVPYAMVPLFVRIFFDSRTAAIAMVTTLLLASIGMRSPYEFVLIETFMGFATIYSLKELTERSQLIRVVGVVILSGLALQLAYDLAQNLTLADLDRTRYLHLAVSGVLLLFAYPLMYLVERLFGFTSSVTLIELTNINNPLMRRLSKVAQGTFNHSMQVSNLAAEVANAIGGKPQLARTGALYHDIGKMLNPAFFTENQSGTNPHDNLAPKDGVSAEEQSARIIVNHVTEGVKLAEKYHLPKVVRDFILTHHGEGVARYFLIQWQNNHPGQQADEKRFAYPGPNPRTKEQAILMMCDAVEASSRSLKEYTEESLQQLVDRIVEGQVKAGYFSDCPLTFRDIREAKRVLVESLKTIYHTRIAYPELNASPEQSVHPRRNLLSGSFRLHN